jgi:hypothetical protein|tara:strand:+ start:556 stop:1116 length:561 start_codon:yes stop_codon:yes gene_type:complete
MMEKGENKNLSKKSKRIWIVRHPFKTFFLMLGVLAVLCFGFLWWVSYELLGPHPCNGWHHGMTDEEKILMVLEHANNSNALVFENTSPDTGVTHRRLNRQVPYNNAASILREQPDCCHVYESTSALTENPKEVDKTLRGDEGTVVLRYMGKSLRGTHGGIHVARVFSYLNLNQCKRHKRRYLFPQL